MASSQLLELFGYMSLVSPFRNRQVPVRALSALSRSGRSWASTTPHIARLTWVSHLESRLAAHHGRAA